MGVGLETETFHGSHEIGLGVVNRHNDGDQGCLWFRVSHSDIYRLIHIWLFVKYYKTFVAIWVCCCFAFSFSPGNVGSCNFVLHVDADSNTHF